jgi:hypothetical protein
MKKFIGQKDGSQKYDLSRCIGATINSNRFNGQKIGLPSEFVLIQMFPIVDEN